MLECGSAEEGEGKGKGNGKGNRKGISCDAIERNLIGLEWSMPRPHERLVFMRVFFVSSLSSLSSNFSFFSRCFIIFFHLSYFPLL